MDIVAYNRQAWDAESEAAQSPWTRPVSPEIIEAARAGTWSVILTPLRPVPAGWFGPIAGARLLALASGGGQQAPVLAAAGARVTSFDNSGVQLDKDRAVAARDGLEVICMQGDMADLSGLPDDSFDIVFNPVSTVFVPDLAPVWAECRRVLKAGGRLMTGFMNPDFYLFDHEAIEKGGPLQVRHALPYADTTHLDPGALAELARRREALQFGHSLDAQIGGLLRAGFRIEGFYEDRWSDEATPLNAFMPTSFAVLAVAV